MESAVYVSTYVVCRKQLNLRYTIEFKSWTYVSPIYKWLGCRLSNHTDQRKIIIQFADRWSLKGHRIPMRPIFYKYKSVRHRFLTQCLDFSFWFRIRGGIGNRTSILRNNVTQCHGLFVSTLRINDTGIRQLSMPSILKPLPPPIIDNGESTFLSEYLPVFEAKIERFQQLYKKPMPHFRQKIEKSISLVCLFKVNR
jgi:hypothetical protein